MQHHDTGLCCVKCDKIHSLSVPKLTKKLNTLSEKHKKNEKRMNKQYM